MFIYLKIGVIDMKKDAFNSNAKSLKRGRPLKKTLDIEFKVSSDGIVYYTDDKGNDIRVCNFVLTCVNDVIEFNDGDEHEYRYYIYEAKIKSVEEKISIKLCESFFRQKHFDIGLSLNYIVFEQRTFFIYVAQVTNNYLKSKNKLINRADAIKVSEPSKIDIERALEFLRRFRDFFISNKEMFESYFASSVDSFNLKDFLGFVELADFDVFYAIRTKEILKVLYGNRSDFFNNSYIKSLYKGLRGLGVLEDSEKSRGYNFKTYRDRNRNPNNMTSCRIVKISKSKIEHIYRIKSNEIFKEFDISFKEFKEMIYKKLELMIEEENKFPFKLKADIKFSLLKVDLDYSDLSDVKFSNPFIFIEYCNFRLDKSEDFLNLEIFLALEFNFELFHIWEFCDEWLCYVFDGVYSNQMEDYDRDRREYSDLQTKFPFISFVYSILHNFMCEFEHFYNINEIKMLGLYENNPNILEPACWTTYDDGKVYYSINSCDDKRIDVCKKYFKGVFSIEDDDRKEIEFSGDTYYNWLNNIATSLDVDIDYQNIDKNHSKLIKICNNRIKHNIIDAIFYIRQNYIYRNNEKRSWTKRRVSISSVDINNFCESYFSSSLDRLFIKEFLEIFESDKTLEVDLFQKLDNKIKELLYKLPNIYLRFILAIYCYSIGIGSKYREYIWNHFDNAYVFLEKLDFYVFNDLDFFNFSKIKQFIDENHNLRLKR